MAGRSTARPAMLALPRAYSSGWRCEAGTHGHTADDADTDTPGCGPSSPHPEAARAQAAVAVRLDDPQRQPYPPKPGRPQGRRTPGVVRVLHFHFGRTV